MSRAPAFLRAMEALSTRRVLLPTVCATVLLFAWNLDAIPELIRAAQGR